MSAVMVVGTGGRVGRALVPALVQAGHRVLAVVRNPATYSVPAAAATGDGQVDVRAGDVRDGDSIRSLLPGHDALVCVVGPAGSRPHALYSAASSAIVQAMGESGPQRLLVLSSAGVRRDDPGLALWYRLVASSVLRALYRDMSAMEGTIRRSSLDWTVIRPSRITDAPPTGDFRVRDGVTPPGGTAIPVGDLAQFIVHEIGSPQWVRATPTLAT